MIELDSFDVANWMRGGEGNYYVVFQSGEIRICDQDCIDAGGYEISPIILSIKCPVAIGTDYAEHEKTFYKTVRQHNEK